MNKITTGQSLANILKNDMMVIDFIRNHTLTSVQDVVDNLGDDAIKTIVPLVEIGAVVDVNGVLKGR